MKNSSIPPVEAPSNAPFLHQRLEPPLPWRKLSCGRMEMYFDPSVGWLRRVTVDGIEAVRAVYGAVRDASWGTFTSQLRNLNIVEDNGGFSITFDVACQAAEAIFHWQAAIIGTPDGVVQFTFTGKSLTAFHRNRIGLCVLHPAMECAGMPCQIEHCDGTVTASHFPQMISPHQPFLNLRAITHQAGKHASIEIRCEGETFETEDQRNWTDASFKTYSTPLSIPFPVWIQAGIAVEQSVTLRLLTQTETLPEITPHRVERIPEISLTGAASMSLPAIGLGMAIHGHSLSVREVAELRLLRPSHLRVDLLLDGNDWIEKWRTAAHDASQLDAALEVAVFLCNEPAITLAALRAEVSTSPAKVCRWLIFHHQEAVTSARWVRLAESILAPGGVFAAGTNANFAELNRSQPATDETALPCFSLNPQVHAFDDASLVENLQALESTVETARHFAPRPLVISPITLRPRSASPILPIQADPRQTSHFAAAWTTGCIARLAALQGLHSLTYFETTGCCGIMEQDEGSPIPDVFPTLPGAVFPLFHILRSLAGATRIHPTRSTHPLVIDGFCVTGVRHEIRWVVANLTNIPQPCRLVTTGSQASITILTDYACHPDDVSNHRILPILDGYLQLHLPPYACAQINIPS